MHITIAFISHWNRGTLKDYKLRAKLTMKFNENEKGDTEHGMLAIQHGHSFASFIAKISLSPADNNVYISCVTHIPPIRCYIGTPDEDLLPFARLRFISE